jgi:hypothetical protein
VEARYLRIAYAIQFVVTMMAVFEIWAQVGGQGHLDLMSWYAKLLLAAALCLATVKATAAAVQGDRFWAARWWLAAVFAVIVVMGMLTLYVHAHEPADDEEAPPAKVDIS